MVAAERHWRAVAAPRHALPGAADASAVTGSYFEAEQFVNKLEGLRRSFLVTGFTLKPIEDSATDTGRDLATFRWTSRSGVPLAAVAASEAPHLPPRSRRSPTRRPSETGA